MNNKQMILDVLGHVREVIDWAIETIETEMVPEIPEEFAGRVRLKTNLNYRDEPEVTEESWAGTYEAGTEFNVVRGWQGEDYPWIELESGYWIAEGNDNYDFVEWL